MAISNHRLVALEDGRVTFRYKDYQRGHRLRTLTRDAVEFLRRLMLHVPPRGFHRLRHFGFLANRVRQEKLTQCRTLLGVAPTPEPAASEPSLKSGEIVEEVPAAHACPACGTGRMVIIATLAAIPINRREWGTILEPIGLDTS